MAISTLPFSRLRQLLLDLHFEEKTGPAAQRIFEHPPSETVFLFRRYKSTEHVNMADLVSVRKQLDERGLLATDSFDHLL